MGYIAHDAVLVTVSDRGQRFGMPDVEAFRQSLLASQGSLGVFWSNGLVSTIMTLGLIALFWPIIQAGWTRVRGRPADLRAAQ